MLMCPTGTKLKFLSVDRPALLAELLPGRPVTEVSGQFVSCEDGDLVFLYNGPDMTRNVLARVIDRCPSRDFAGKELVTLKRVGPAML